jgi:hypothetical protein
MHGNNEGMLGDAVAVAVRRGLVGPKQHVVCVMSVRNDLVLKVVSVDDFGKGITHSLSSSGEPLSIQCTPGGFTLAGKLGPCMSLTW